jgi:hypothetical protein
LKSCHANKPKPRHDDVIIVRSSGGGAATTTTMFIHNEKVLLVYVQCSDIEIG